MEKNLEQISRILLEDDLFSTCTRRDIVRLMPFIELKKYRPNEEIYRIGDPANHIQFIISGKIELQSDRRIVKTIESGSFGEEAIRKDSKYLLKAVAVEDTVIFSIPEEAFDEILQNNTHFKDSTYSSLINHFSYEKMDIVRKSSRKKQKDDSVMKIIGWFSTLIVPPVLYYFLNSMGFKWEQIIFITVASATLLMWIFRLANEFIPSLLAIIVIIILQVAPPKVALSGFTNDSFFMAMSIFGISSVLVTSGLTFRLVINMLKFFPMSQYWHARTLLFTGIIMTPLLPSANGRIVMAVPILKDMIESLGYEKKGSAANLLGVTAFMGFTFFSSAFLSSKAIHFVVFGLFPQQIQEQFTWSYWFYASIPSFLIMLGVLVLVLKLIYKKDEKPKLSKEIIDVQKAILGPMTKREWAALGGILLFGIGIATSSLHKIEMSWIGLIVLYVVLVLGILSKDDFQKQIDWTFLIYQAALIGLVKTISYTGLDTILGNHLLWIGDYTKSNIFIFIIILSGAILFLRLFIPNNATVVIISSILFPIAELSGLNTWVIAIIILTMSDAWFLPYQCTYYVQFEEMMESKKLVNMKEIIGVNAFSVIIRLGAIFASIPYWRLIGLL